MEFEASKTTIGKTSGRNKFQVFNYSSSPPPPLSSRSANNKNFYICNELNTIEKICDKDPILKLIFSLSSSSFDSKIALQNEIRAKLTELNSSESISSTQRTAMSSTTTTTSQQIAAAMATKSAYLQQLESKRNRQRLLEPYSSSSTTTTFNNQRMSTQNPIESSKTNPISSNDDVIECFKPIEKPEFLKKVDTYIRVNPSAAADNAMSFGKPKSIARRPMDLDERYNLKVHRRPISTTTTTTTSMKAAQKQQPQPQQQEKQEDLNEDESHNLRAAKNVSTDKDEMIINDEKEEEVIESQTKKEVEEAEIVADLKTIDDEIIMINEELDNQVIKENLNDNNNLNGNEIQNDDEKLLNNNENSFEIMENQFNLESTNNKENAAEDNEITNNFNNDDVEPKQPEIVEENQTMRVKLNTKSFLEKLFNRELNLNHDFDNNDDDERENRDDDDDDSLKENADKKNLDDKERVVAVELPKEVENVLDMLFSRKDAINISNDKQIKEQISEEKLEEMPDRKQQRTESSSSTNSAADNDEKAATTIKSDLSSSLILKNENLNRAKENLNRQPQKTSIKREKLIKQPSLNSNVTTTSVENKTNQDENRIVTRKEKPINNRVANVKKKNVTFIEDPKYGMIAVEIPEWQETLRDRHASPDAMRKRKLFAKKAT